MSRVLLVTDCDRSKAHTKTTLEAFGLSVCATNAENRVVRALTIHHPTHMFSDVETAGGDGFESVATARRASTKLMIVAFARGGVCQDRWPMVAAACGADIYAAGPLSIAVIAHAFGARLYVRGGSPRPHSKRFVCASGAAGDCLLLQPRKPHQSKVPAACRCRRSLYDSRSVRTSTCAWKRSESSTRRFSRARYPRRSLCVRRACATCLPILWKRPLPDVAIG